MQTGKYMRIGAVVELTGLCANTIRRMEARGLVRPARDWNGTRRFTEKDVAALCALIAPPRRRAESQRRRTATA